MPPNDVINYLTVTRSCVHLSPRISATLGSYNIIRAVSCNSRGEFLNMTAHISDKFVCQMLELY